MQNTPEKQLLINYLLGICTPGEYKYVEEWLDEAPDNIFVLQQTAKSLMLAQKDFTIDKRDIKEQVFSKLDERLNTNPANKQSSIQSIGKPQHKNNAFRKSDLFIKSTVFVMALIIASMLSLQHIHTLESAAELENEITLLERSLSYGQTSTFRFSDGSVITLNGGSKLTYPAHFTPNKREVFLQGEAFFDISHDQTRPFIVHANNSTIRVLGTSFNIKAYDNEPEMNVAVVDGKVEVSKKRKNTTIQTDSEKLILEENQWATYQNSGELMEQGKGDLWEYVAWKDQVLIFNDKPFSEVARMLERWYGVEIIVKDDHLKETVLKGEHKNVSLEQVLESIQYVLGIEFTINNQVVFIHSIDK